MYRFTYSITGVSRRVQKIYDFFVVQLKRGKSHDELFALKMFIACPNEFGKEYHRPLEENIRFIRDFRLSENCLEKMKK